MTTNYHTDQRPSYECSSRRDQATTPDLPVGGRGHAWTPRSPSALLAALTPEQVALALAAADEVTDRRQRVSRAAELAVERARYEADRAERAFHAVEPENRLVARTLEARWETKLAALAEAEQALEAARDTLPPLPSRADLERLAADLPALWHAPTTSAQGPQTAAAHPDRRHHPAVSTPILSPGPGRETRGTSPLSGPARGAATGGMMLAGGWLSEKETPPQCRMECPPPPQVAIPWEDSRGLGSDSVASPVDEPARASRRSRLEDAARG